MRSGRRDVESRRRTGPGQGRYAIVRSGMGVAFSREPWRLEGAAAARCAEEPRTRSPTMADDITRKSGEKNELDGKTKGRGGRIQRAFGDLTDDPHHQGEGGKEPVKGKGQEKIGEAQRTIDDLDRKI